MSKDFSKDLNIDETELDEVSIGTPYIVYDVANPIQDEIYHYPIINDRSDNVVLMVNVMGTTDGWHYDISTENISKLNALNYANEEYIFYGAEGNTIAENEKTKKQFTGNDSNTAIQNFENCEWDEKVDIISERMDELQKTTTNIPANRDLQVTYTPKVVDVEVGTGKKCELYNRKSQDFFALCWAASIATISNYLNGTNHTPYQIADKEGIGYNSGADTSQILKAMKDFNVPYSIYGNTLSWDNIIYKITSKTPIYMISEVRNEAHATVLYGYKVKNGVQYIAIWNPGTNFEGATEVIEFNGSATTYSYEGLTFTWNQSIYR